MSLFLVLFLLSSVSNADFAYAKYNPKACNVKLDKCKTRCDNSYKITKKDLFGKKVKESKLNKKNRSNCKTKCKELKNLCRARQKQKRPSKTKSRESYIQPEKQYKHPSNYKIIRYKDENGNLYFTNNYDDIPEKYRSEIILEGK